MGSFNGNCTSSFNLYMLVISKSNFTLLWFIQICKHRLLPRHVIRTSTIHKLYFIETIINWRMSHKEVAFLSNLLYKVSFLQLAYLFLPTISFFMAKKFAIMTLNIAHMLTLIIRTTFASITTKTPTSITTSTSAMTTGVVCWFWFVWKLILQLKSLFIHFFKGFLGPPFMSYNESINSSKLNMERSFDSSMAAATWSKFFVLLNFVIFYLLQSHHSPYH